MTVSFDVDKAVINSKERQYDQFMRIMEKKEDLASNKLTPSEKYQVRELDSEDMAVQGINGDVT